LGGVLASAYGWRSSYLVFAVVSLGAVVALWRSIPAFPAGRGAPLGKLARGVLGSRDLWLLYVSGMPSVAAAWLLIAWAPTVLLEVSGFDLTGASVLASGVGFVAVPALVGGGLLSDRFARRGLGRKGLIALGHLWLAAMCLLLSVGLAQHWSASLVALLLVLTSLAQWSPWALIYALLAEMAPPAAAGMAFGLGASLWSLGSLTAPWLAGVARDASGGFSGVFFAMAGFSLGGALLALAIRPVFRFGAEPRLAFDRPADNSLGPWLTTRRSLSSGTPGSRRSASTDPRSGMP
jgi:predicted MFS family arabinose efflux permease